MSKTVDRVKQILEEALALLDGVEDTPEPSADLEPSVVADPPDGEVELTGRIGRPTFTTTSRGYSLWKAGLGISDTTGNLQWLKIQAWRNVADTANQFERGETVTVCGRHSVNEFVDRDGKMQRQDVFTISRIDLAENQSD